MILFLLSLVIFSDASVISNFAENLSGKALVDFINQQQSFYRAELSNFTTDEMRAKVMPGRFAENSESLPEAAQIPISNSDIPESFDARKKWSNCPSIGAIYDQADCGSCWAFCTAETMSDRTCIATSKQIVYSVNDILSCCENCGFGCNGGYPNKAFNYWNNVGVCTGGPFRSKGNCKPYAFHPCGYHKGDHIVVPCASNQPTPECETSCQKGYDIPYTQDRHFGAGTYYVSSNEANIQKEIMTYGPVTATYDVYEDFYHYKSGIYVHTEGKYVGAHCVKIIGWGSENGTPYWLVVNSWNSDWGEDGLFRIIRRTNRVNFENRIVTASARG